MRNRILILTVLSMFLAGAGPAIAQKKCGAKEDDEKYEQKFNRVGFGLAPSKVTKDKNFAVAVFGTTE